VTKRQMLAEIDRVLEDEKAYAARLWDQGDIGRAKLALAAIGEVEAALQANGQGLLDELRQRRSEFQSLWDDEDGVGGATFLRVLDLIEAAE